MIKARTKNSIILGLSDHNMERLSQDQPIKFNLSELGLQDMIVMIFNGKDEATMQRILQDGFDAITIKRDSYVVTMRYSEQIYAYAALNSVTREVTDEIVSLAREQFRAEIAAQKGASS